MINRSLRAAALATLLSAAALPALAADADPVVAVVNGQEIHKSALLAAQQGNMQARQAPLEAIYEQLLDDVIISQLLQEQALKAKYDEDPMVKTALKQAQEHILASFYLQKKVESDITDDMIKARYEEIKAKTPARPAVRVRHILVKTEAEAHAVEADLKKGVKFEDEAKAKSLDKHTGENGGEIGFISKEDPVPPEFSAAALKLKDGEISKPVKTQFGYHIIQAEEHGTAPTPSLEEAKAAIRQALAREDVPKVIAMLQKNAQIKKFKLDGSPDDAPTAAPAKN